MVARTTKATPTATHGHLRRGAMSGVYSDGVGRSAPGGGGRRKMCVLAGNAPRSSRTNVATAPVAVLTVLRQRLGKHTVDIGRELGTEDPGARDRALQVGGDTGGVVGRIAEGRPPGQHLEGGACQRVDVGAAVELRGAGDLLGRGVVGSAEEEAWGVGLTVAELGDAEVHEKR